MTRQNMIVVALGSLAIASAPMAFAHAQSGDALAHAENTCLDHGIGPSSAVFNTCVTRAAMAYDNGQPGLAGIEAQRAADARTVCLSYGLEPTTMGYRECTANELRGAMTIQAVRAPVASYGFYTDRNGDLRNGNGELIRPVPVAVNQAYLPY